MGFRTWARAVCALILVMGAALGVTGVVVRTQPAGAATATTDDVRAAAAELVGFIPEDVRYQCTIDTNPRPSSVQTAPGTIRVGLDCPGTDGVELVQYYLFADNGAMNNVYTQAIGSAGTDPVRSEEGKCPSDGTWTLDGKEAGKSACYYATTETDSTGQVTTLPEYPVRVWTDDAENILTTARMPPGNTDAVALRTWWLNKAGPTATAATVNGVVSSDAGVAQYERALLQHVPAVTRKHCTSTDLTDPTNTYEYARRLWLRAAVSCPTTGGAESVFYDSMAPAVVGPFFAGKIAAEKETESASQPNSNCPANGTYKVGKGKQARPGGQYACSSPSQNSTFNNGAPYAYYTWSDPKLGIVGSATNGADDPDALIAWFNSSRSGPS